jgi:hypothetical protein
MIESGDRFREAGPSSPWRRGLVWYVDAVFIGTDGLEYAALVCTSDVSMRKTLATAALADRRRFVRVAD